MPQNKVGLVINSRMYTVVSYESVEYMEMLGEHINEKVSAVIRDGRHITGEKPIVLAALNICDEYYKLLEEKSNTDLNELASVREENEKLKEETEALRKKNELLLTEIEKLKKEGIEKAQTEAIENNAELQKKFEEARTQIKFLEGKLNDAEEKNETLKRDHERRETELLEMFKNTSPEQKPMNRAERRAAARKSKRNK